MNAIFAKRRAEKHANREREISVLAAKMDSPVSLAKKNFCLKGVDIKKARRAGGVYAIF